MYRGQQGYSLAEVAEMTGVAKGTLEHWKHIGLLGKPIAGTGRRHARYDDEFVRDVEYTKRHFRDHNISLKEFTERRRASKRGSRLLRTHSRPRTVGAGDSSGISDEAS